MSTAGSPFHFETAGAKVSTYQLIVSLAPGEAVLKSKPSFIAASALIPKGRLPLLIAKPGRSNPSRGPYPGRPYRERMITAIKLTAKPPAAASLKPTSHPPLALLWSATTRRRFVHQPGFGLVSLHRFGALLAASCNAPQIRNPA